MVNDDGRLFWLFLINLVSTLWMHPCTNIIGLIFLIKHLICSSVFWCNEMVLISLWSATLRVVMRLFVKLGINNSTKTDNALIVIDYLIGWRFFESDSTSFHVDFLSEFSISLMWICRPSGDYTSTLETLESMIIHEGKLLFMILKWAFINSWLFMKVMIVHGI